MAKFITKDSGKYVVSLWSYTGNKRYVFVKKQAAINFVNKAARASNFMYAQVSSINGKEYVKGKYDAKRAKEILYGGNRKSTRQQDWEQDNQWERF